MVAAQSTTLPLRDRVAIVTGAASGIGEATARKLCGQGAAVYGLDRQNDSLHVLANELEQFYACTLDLTNHDAMKQVVKQVIADTGRVDILVNNAGFSHHERLEESSLENWRATFCVNLEAMYVLGKIVAPHMKRAGYGRIVNVGSVQGFGAQNNVGAYAATKGGVHAWTRSLAVDLAEFGIIVNAVAPGAIHTPMSIVDGVDVKRTPEFREWYEQKRRIPIGRAGEAHEVADAIAYLCSDQCTYIVGHTLVVDGGLTITF